MVESKYFRELLNEIGSSVHNLNTIAVALSNLSQSSTVNPALNIKWEPKNISVSSVNARRFAVRSSLVFAAETLFEYMYSISSDPMWQSLDNKLDFHNELPSQDSKARRFSEFCKHIPGIEKEWYLLTELMCHWRNRIVHSSTSKAALSSTDRQYLESRAKEIYTNFHHFDVRKMLLDYEADKVTLKEATTLITFLIKCCRKIDEFYLGSIATCNDEVFHEVLESKKVFQKILKQKYSLKRNRQINRFALLTLSYLPAEKVERLIIKYT